MTIKEKLNNGSRVPQYVHIRDHLAEQIESGNAVANSKLPSERELAASYNTTHVAVREALIALETEGKIYRLDRRGWFVSAPRVVYDPRSTKSFMQYVSEQGREPSTELLSAELVPATTWAAKHLNIKEGDPIYSIWRRRSIDGRPVLVEHLRINAAFFPNFLDIALNRSITEIMRQFYSTHLTRAKITLYPTSLAATQAKHLLVSPGTLGIYIRRNNQDQHGRITDVDQEFWLHDVLEISMEAHDTSISSATN